jgi:transcriptional regulator of acetoin/glycerol metabolism
VIETASWESFISDRVTDPKDVRPRPGSEGEVDPSYELSLELMRAASDVLSSTEGALADTLSWLALADSRGIVSYEWASTPGLKAALSRADIGVGAVLTEEQVGANGIGRALARRKIALVRGEEHGNERWHGLTCGASPIVHPVSRRLMGVVNVTCLVEEQNQHLKLTLNTLVTGIQSALLRRTSSRHQRLLDAHTRVQRQTNLAVLTLDAQTMIVEEGLGAELMDREVLWSMVQQIGPMASEITLPNGQRLQVIPVVRGRPSDGVTLIFDPNDFRPALAAEALLSPERLHWNRSRLSPLERAEFDVILSAMQQTSGNKTEAAAQLEISRGTLYERLRRYGIQA